MKNLPIALLTMMPLFAFADQAPVSQVPVRDPIPEAAMLDRLERISLPIGKGAILQDRRGCLWSVMEGEKAPRLVALTDEVNKPLCRTVEVDQAPHSPLPVQK
ncbi:hypothetical protein KBJ94_23420 [Pseudomonas sp. ITA]|uniref:hypothetical protein n=1 Tax=Pseudomonas sp. ITA TaxID=2825841 RepID=UPI0024976E16|nr:hypothetical protein [Pseudomonas sp. ITA]MDI2145004.1 hypothetical protein [Pseudomonas sp. ITA]